MQTEDSLDLAADSDRESEMAHLMDLAETLDEIEALLTIPGFIKLLAGVT